MQDEGDGNAGGQEGFVHTAGCQFGGSRVLCVALSVFCFRLLSFISASFLNFHVG